MREAQQVERAADCLGDYVVDSGRAGVEGGDRRHDDRSRFGGLDHQPQVARVHRGFAKQQDQGAPFLEGDIGGTDEQGVVVAGGDA